MRTKIDRTPDPHPLQDFILAMFNERTPKRDEFDLAFRMAGRASKMSKYKVAAKDALDHLVKTGVLERDAEGWYHKKKESHEQRTRQQRTRQQ